MRIRAFLACGLTPVLMLVSPVSRAPAQEKKAPVALEEIVKQQQTIHQKLKEFSEELLRAAALLERADDAADKAAGKRLAALARSTRMTDSLIRSAALVKLLADGDVKKLPAAKDACDHAKKLQMDLDELLALLRSGRGAPAPVASLLKSARLGQHSALLDLNAYHDHLVRELLDAVLDSKSDKKK